ncbi:helix-turn-helix transcriptional regulator [Adlercreutzia equolifaciens]|uniref:helix-turn-helix transcriptional regulator n=1 Tax=Adlercreutzia equolifaciens TaxID=446660 RepID=UPI0023B1EE89|nr:helix-turn-helix transcriptional regulator [Adlercreutzia equolifaciens]MDE8702656.1 helix-turn-helix transcriptional regulator [Adlercreutzia equolifaciens]
MAGRAIPSWAAGDPSSMPFVLRPIHGALAAFVLTLPAYTPTLSYFSGAPQAWALSDAFLFALLLGALLVAVLMTVRGLQTSPQVREGGISSRVAVAAYVGAIALFLALLFQEQPVPLLATFAGFVAGAALPILVTAWARMVAVPMDRALLLCGFVGVVVSFLGWVLSLLPVHLLVPVYGVLVLAGVVPLWVGARVQGTGDGFPEAAPRGALRDLLSVTWLPLLGLAVFAFMTTVMAHSAFGVVQATFLGGVLAAVIVFGVCFLWGRKPLLPWCYRVLVPLLGAVFVVLGAFPADTFPREVSVVALYLFYLALAMLGCALFLAVVHARELPAQAAVGFGVSVVALAALMGCILSQVLQVAADFSPWLTVLTGAFIAVLLVFLGRTAWDELGELQEARAAATAEATEGALVADSVLADLPVRVPLEARCAALAERFGLSPREAEILVYLARGFSPTYIAKDLVLSVSTVRTHVRNIYRKLGIGKREELIHLVDEE